jgi:tetratricopeptide (TPR) repeat protein
MKKMYLTLACLSLLFILLSLRERKKVKSIKFSRVSLCGSFFQAFDTTAYLPVRLHEGLGDLHYPITTSVPEAQKYFDQGLKLVYGFNHVEALRSFNEAARLDPNSPMVYWGQALALGPNINDWNPMDREAMAFKAIQNARKAISNGSQKEIDFVMAMAARYNGKAYNVRDSLNFSYEQAMRKLSKKYPEDAEALTLFADALMMGSPWDYWLKDGSPKARTKEARAALESAMMKFPKHPGAHHLYVHLIEASSKPADAMKSATVLETIMPAAGHIVHMPSHIYVRVGKYERSNYVNDLAVKVDEEFLTRTDDGGMYRIGYYPHNIDFLHYGQLMTGQRDASLSQAIKLVYQMKPMEQFAPAMYDFFYPAPAVVQVRFGQWNEILALPAPNDNMYHTAATQRFARGLAFLRKGKVKEAKRELAVLDSLNKLDTMKKIKAFYNTAAHFSKVPTEILRGEVLLAQGKVEQGLSALKIAVGTEDSLRYNEPPDWRIPSRHYLGAAFLDAGQHANAEKTFLEDLVRNPDNGWALKGLSLAQQKLGKTKEAAATESRFKDVWKKADVQITTSRF